MPDDRADKVQLLVLDVDGVLTDGGIYLDDHGVETKRFHVRDGTGIRLWRELGYETAIITGRSGQVVRHRAEELGIEHVFQGNKEKAEPFRQLLARLRLPASAAAMIADDVPDLSIMRVAGYPIAVADAVPEIKALAAYVTFQPGGQGAVRESIEHLLRSKGRWDEAIASSG
jgi:3-deoxy-D-manno-octulosonate 8-phosphate phosphatase (KDO 8-P phosphatase)